MSRLVYGLHPVQQVLQRRPREVAALFVAAQGPRPRSQLEPLLKLARERGLKVLHVEGQELVALTGGANHQGVAATVGPFPYLDVEGLLERDTTRPPLILAVDSVTDPQNLGAILRSALVLGATGVVIPKDRAAQITPTVVRVSAGASEHLPCARVVNLARALDRLRDLGLWIAGTVESGGVHPAEADLEVPLVIVLGSEHSGIRPLVLKKCDLRLTIPSAAGAIASLNVAAAATAVLYEAARQRRARDTR
jgi:23S rRNA (guanosine2251-2'-O)-methyltransferase